MATPSEFERALVRIGATVAKGGDAAVRKAFLAIDQAVVLATPVDTGAARSNWLPGFNSPVSGQREPYVPGVKGSSAAANAEAAMEAAKKVADQYDGETHRSLHLTNNLPYIGELNRGTSTQAPKLFVETAVAAGARAVPGTKVLE